MVLRRLNLGEHFEEPEVIGGVLSIRGRETIIELWFNYNRNDTVKGVCAQRMKQLIQIESNLTLFFKETDQSAKDKSTLRNAESYSFIPRKESKK